jgi:hypothetical protein
MLRQAALIIWRISAIGHHPLKPEFELASMSEHDLEALRYPIGRYTKPVSFDPAALKPLISQFEALPLWLDYAIENLDAEQLHTPYRPGGWTIVQVIHHIADSHMNAYIRFKLALTEDNPTIKPYEEAAWAETPDIEATPVNVSVTLLHALHRRWSDAMRRLEDAQWERSFFHPEQQRSIPLWELTALYAWHGRHHVEHIRGLRGRMNW